MSRVITSERSVPVEGARPTEATDGQAMRILEMSLRPRRYKHRVQRHLQRNFLNKGRNPREARRALEAG